LFELRIKTIKEFSVTFINGGLSVKPALVFKNRSLLTERLYAFSLSLSLLLQVTRMPCNRWKRSVPQKRPRESELSVKSKHCSRLYPLLTFTSLTINTNETDISVIVLIAWPL